MTMTASAPAAGREKRRHRVRTPVRLQMEATECGAASLGIVLWHYGRYVPLEELRERCGISRDGSNALAMKRAAEQYGLEVAAKRTRAGSLKTMDMPVIAFWRNSHFLVVEGHGPHGWYLNDPALGHREVSDEEFSESYSGLILRAVPGAEFVRGGRPPRLVSRLGRYLVGSRDGVLLMAFLGILLIVPQILIPGISRLFVDWLDGGPQVQVTTLLSVMVFAAVLQAAIIGLQGTVGMRLATKMSIVLQSAIVSRLLSLSAGFHAQRGAAALAQRALLPESVAATVSTMFSTMAVGIISSVTAIALMLLAYPPAGLVALTALLVIVATMMWVSRRRRTLAMRMIREQLDVVGLTVVTLGQIEVLKASGSEDHIAARWTSAHDRFLTALQNLGQRTVIPDLVPGFLLMVANVGVTVVGLIGVTTGKLSMGSFVAVQTLLGLALSPAAMVVGQVQAAETLTGQLDEIDDVLHYEPARVTVVEVTAPDVTVLRGELSLVDVTFGYDPNHAPLITNFSLHVSPGSRVALVGPSGCGKSTVARLVTGLYVPWSGEVLIDGYPRVAWPERLLTREIALVDQDPMIFAGSFRDNITLWDPTIGDADVIEAARAAHLHDEIARRPGSYEAILRAGGSDLSGGQRQRLEIARALVRRPSLLVLDEATSALDAATEASIDLAIRRLGASAVVVAHRLSTVRDADEIVVLDKGQVVERGRHDDLILNDGPYRRLVAA